MRKCATRKFAATAATEAGSDDSSQLTNRHIPCRWTCKVSWETCGSEYRRYDANEADGNDWLKITGVVLVVGDRLTRSYLVLVRQMGITARP